jgi:hypothetical protein
MSSPSTKADISDKGSGGLSANSGDGMVQRFIQEVGGATPPSPK